MRSTLINTCTMQYKLLCDCGRLFDDIVNQAEQFVSSKSEYIMNYVIEKKDTESVYVVPATAKVVLNTHVNIENLDFDAIYYVYDDKRFINYGSGIVVQVKESEICVYYQKRFMEENYHKLYTPYLLFTSIIYEVESIKGRYVLHASSVVKNKNGIVILGLKGSGKSTLAINLAYKHEFRYMSDDKLIYDNDKGIIYAAPDVIRLNKDMYYETFGKSKEELHYSELYRQKIACNINALSVQREDIAYPRVILMPNVCMDKEEYFEIQNASIVEIYEALLEHRIVAFEHSTNGIFESLNQMLKKCKVYKLKIGTDVLYNCTRIIELVNQMECFEN